MAERGDSRWLNRGIPDDRMGKFPIGFTIRDLPSGICRLPSAVCRLPSVIRHPSSAICHPSSAIRHLSSGIRLTAVLHQLHRHLLESDPAPPPPPAAVVFEVA